MTPTRLRTLMGIAVALAVVSWLLLRTVYSSLPSFPWTMVPALIIAAGGEAITGRGLRARILGRPGAKAVPALQVARMVALAKASSLAAAVIGGVAAGFAGAAAGPLPARGPRPARLAPAPPVPRGGGLRRPRGGLAAGRGRRPRRADLDQHVRRGGAAGRGRAVPGTLLPHPRGSRRGPLRAAATTAD